MKREELEQLFDGKLAEGIESKELINSIMSINGADINKAKGNAEEIEKAKQDAITEALKPYVEGGEKFNEYAKIIEENKAYREKEVKSLQKASQLELAKKGNFDERFSKLIPRIIDDYKPIYDEQQKITNEDDVLKGLINDYGDFQIKAVQGGYTPPQEIPTPKTSAEMSDQEVYDAYFKSKRK